MSGKIYILRNDSYKPDVVKIGFTERSSEIRVAELSRSTGVPESFEVLYEESVVDPRKAEILIHQQLSKFRIKSNKEFFKLPLKQAVRTVFSICSQMNNERIKKIIIFINSENQTTKSLELIKDKITQNTGTVEIEIKLIFQNKSELTISVLDKYNVHYSEQLIAELASIDCVDDVIPN